MNCQTDVLDVRDAIVPPRTGKFNEIKRVDRTALLLFRCRGLNLQDMQPSLTLTTLRTNVCSLSAQNKREMIHETMITSVVLL